MGREAVFMEDPPKEDILVIGNPISGYRCFVNGAETDCIEVFNKVEAERLKLRDEVNKMRESNGSPTYD